MLIYVHKEKALADVERMYPAKHYVMIGDKLRILAAIKKHWKDRVTTVFPKQGITPTTTRSSRTIHPQTSAFPILALS